MVITHLHTRKERKLKKSKPPSVNGCTGILHIQPEAEVPATHQKHTDGTVIYLGSLDYLQNRYVLDIMTEYLTVISSECSSAAFLKVWAGKSWLF